MDKSEKKKRLLAAEHCSAQLAVFAGAAIVAAMMNLLFFQLGLTTDTKPDAGNRLAARFGNSRLTLVAVGQAGTARQAVLRSLNGIANTGIDLFMNRPISAPATGHNHYSPGSIPEIIRNNLQVLFILVLDSLCSISVQAGT